MQTSASTQALEYPTNANGFHSNNNNNFDTVNDVMNLTPFSGFNNIVNGLKEMMRGGKNSKFKEMTRITPSFKDTSSGPNAPGEISLDPFFQPSPKIPINFLPSTSINEIDGWTIRNKGILAVPTPQSDLGFPGPISSSFGDNTLTDPTGTL